MTKAAAAPKEKKEKPAKPEKAPKIEQNGITRPGTNTTTGQVWAVADKISAKLKAPAPRGDVMKECVAAGINEATVATQYGKWRKFNGVVAEPKAKAEKPAKAPKAKKEEAAE